MQSNIRIDKDVNDQDGGRVLSISIILFQIGISVLYGLFIDLTQQFISITSVFLCIALATLTIAGTSTTIKDLDSYSHILNGSLGLV